MSDRYYIYGGWVPKPGEIDPALEPEDVDQTEVETVWFTFVVGPTSRKGIEVYVTAPYNDSMVIILPLVADRKEQPTDEFLDALGEMFR